MSHPFRYYLRVRYGECDAQKVVFNARWGDYVDLAVLEFLRALGLGAQMFAGPLDYQVVKQTVEWKAPARFDDVLEVSVTSTHLGRTSFTLGCEFRRAGEPAVLVRTETVYVLVDAQKLAKTPLPLDVRHALAAGAPGQVTDHAAQPASAGR